MKIDSYIKEQFGIKHVDIRTYSPLTLAYIGDGIFDIVIRSVVVGKGNTKANLLHKHTSNIVKAHTQALMIEALLPHLTEEESDVYHRGRNAKSPSMAKNATMADYRKATGLSGGRLRLETGTGVPCEGVPAWRAGGTGAAARLYSGQQRGEAAA